MKNHTRDLSKLARLCLAVSAPFVLGGCVTPAGQAFINRMGNIAAMTAVSETVYQEMNPGNNNVNMRNDYEQRTYVEETFPQGLFTFNKWVDFDGNSFGYF